MRRVLFAALLVGMLGAAALSPALATSHMPAADMCPHDATIDSFATCIVHMGDQGVIDNSGIVVSLTAKVDAANAAADRGQSAVALRQLEALAHEVEAQAGEHIAEPHAGHLVMHIQMVLDALGA